MIVAVTGGRYYNNIQNLWRILDNTLKTIEHINLLADGASDDVTGPYIGADYWCHQWALARNISTVRVHADWKQYGKAAGPIRNKAIIDNHKPDLLVAFPGNNGTRNMIALCQKAGISIRFVND